MKSFIIATALLTSSLALPNTAQAAECRYVAHDSNIEHCVSSDGIHSVVLAGRAGKRFLMLVELPDGTMVSQACTVAEPVHCTQFARIK